MHIVWGLVLVVLSLLCWGDQVIVWFAPSTAARLTLMESEDTVEPAYFADIRGEALWDALTLWTMLVAGVLLLLGEPAWAYFALAGGGMYVYFAGRGIFTRVALRRSGHRIGNAQNTRLGFALLTIWGVMALATITASVIALSTS